MGPELFPLHSQNNDTTNYDEGRIDVEHDSYLEMAGKAITPIMEPLGFHWRASVAARRCAGKKR